MDDVRARKHQLLQEFEREIAPQKLQLEALLPNLWKTCYGPNALPTPPASALGAGVSKAGAKRVPASGSSPEAKRPRTEEMERRMEPMMRECAKIIKKLLNIQSSVWFRKPVDPVKDGCPNYLLYVKTPMDLGTVKNKLQMKAYRSPLEFRDDVDLIWRNCATYNQEGQPARVDGDKCKAAFDRAWRDSGIEVQLQQIQDELDTAAAPLHERVGTLSNQLVRAIEQLPVSALPEGSARREMSFAEKRRLSMRLGALQPEMCQGVLDIVAADPRVTMSADGEVELEIDELRADTLWKIHDFLERPMSKQAPQSKPTSRPVTADQTMGIAEKQMSSKDQNGAASMHSEGAGSDSDSGEHSPNELKGSTMDPHEGPSAFVRDARDGRNVVDESATNANEQSRFIKDKAAARKDVNINASNWDLLASAPSDAGTNDAQPEADDMWKSFQSIAEQKQQREEVQRQEAEQAERQRREERERKKKEEDERQQRLREEEERQAAEMQKQRDEQMQKELEEMKAQAGTANLTQQSDVASMLVPAGSGPRLAALGLDNQDDDEDMNFEDEL